MRVSRTSIIPTCHPLHRVVIRIHCTGACLTHRNNIRGYLPLAPKTRLLAFAPLDFYFTHMDQAYVRRTSQVDSHTLYFWTATIHNWYPLLLRDHLKMEIIHSLQWLTERSLIKVYAYVIMPNHMHLIWKVLDNNGKESPHGSLLKFTAHRFRKYLLEENPQELIHFEVQAPNKRHEFWQRDSLAIPLYNRWFILQKLTYLHNNPVAKHWRLASAPSAYRFSSAAFYESGVDEFGFLKHLGDNF